MTHEQLVEKVAGAMWRFIYNEDVAPWDGKDTQYDDDKEFMRDKARAAIAAIYEAMREPTPMMTACAWRAWKSRHQNRIGPGPAFREALEAMLEASPLKGE